LIIAEIGNNHEGSYALAEEMIGLAAASGAGAVKFQTIVPERLVSVQQTERIKQLKRFQLSYDEFGMLAEVAKKEEIIFLSTPFDIDSALFLNDLVPAFKIASGDNDFFPLIEVIANTGKPIIMSTGLMDFNEIKNSALFIRKIWKENRINQDLALLHCLSSYPTPLESANLLAIRELRTVSDTVGYSDHTLGIEASVLSVAMGARIIEKHFTIDNNYSDFHDHQFSADPTDFKEMVDGIHSVEKMLGEAIKIPNDSELKNKINIRRSIVAKHYLEAGHEISPNDISWVRPGIGMRPGEEKILFGKVLKTNIWKGNIITLKDLC
jgi:N-acetylneuraminate synthase/N,N'-diacetyllegionaminate synthase